MRLKKPTIYYTSAYGVAATATGYWLSTQVKGLSAQQVSQLSLNNLGKWDREAAANYSPTASKYSYATVITTAAIPGIMSFSKNVRADFYTYNTVYAQTLLSTTGQVLLLKSLVKKSRPFVYGNTATLDEKMKPTSRFSFPSGHTAIAAAASFYGAMTYSLYYPKSKYKPLVWAGAAIVPLISGYLRYRAGKHFIGDIATGYAIGAANGIVFPLLFKIGK